MRISYIYSVTVPAPWLSLLKKKKKNFGLYWEENGSNRWVVEIRIKEIKGNLKTELFVVLVELMMQSFWFLLNFTGNSFIFRVYPVSQR